jgi:hypothetical protein
MLQKHVCLTLQVYKSSDYSCLNDDYDCFFHKLQLTVILIGCYIGCAFDEMSLNKRDSVLLIFMF